MLDRAIEHGKEHRQKYRRLKAFDRTCRNHGSCTYCKGNRLHCSNKRLLAANEQLKAIQYDELTEDQLYLTMEAVVL